MMWSNNRPKEPGWYWLLIPSESSDIHMVGLSKETDPSGGSWMCCDFCTTMSTGWSFEAADGPPEDADELDKDALWIAIERPSLPKEARQ